jgi:hypothetical protein
MTVDINDRPIETVRSEVIDQLIMNYSHGKISYEAFERRLDKAMATEHNSTLLELVADLPLSVDQEFVDSKKRDLGLNYAPGVAKESETVINVLSGSNRAGQWKVPKEIKVYSVLSGASLDFSEAIFSNKEVHIKIVSILSGDDIYVPENINVVSNVFCIVGSIDNRACSSNNPNAPTIYIDGYTIFSGLNITIKKTLKERFVIFADELKKMFS